MNFPDVYRSLRLNKYLLVAVIVFLLLLKVFLCGSFVAEAAAFGGGGGGGRGGGMGPPAQEVSADQIMQTLTSKLQLNPGQVAEIRPILKDFIKQSKDMEPQNMGRGQGMGSQSTEQGRGGKNPMAAKKEKMLDEASVFLNAEQFKQFEEIIASLNQPGQQNGSGEGR